jgi:hypothetical protein
MILFLTRLFILLLCGYALYRLWWNYRSTDRWINIVIAAGFLARAVVGQLMFWISYARLPVARPLQMGDGLWFFARDALLYFPVATGLARSGIGAIIEYPTTGASVAFVKVLATAVLLLGSVTSVALLLNLFCYLGMMAVIVRWSAREARARTAAALAICAIALSPAFFLWSLQPLKDTFFQFIVIAFIGACAMWQRTWTSSPVSAPMACFAAGAMTVALLAIAGVRWYFAFVLFLAAIVFLFLIASISVGRKTVAFAATVVLLVLLSRAMLLGGGAYVPAVIVNTLTPSTALAEARGLPSQMIAHLNRARDGFQRSGGTTSIRQGGNLSTPDGSTIDGTAAADSDQAAIPPPDTPAPVASPPGSSDGKHVEAAGPVGPPPVPATASHAAAPAAASTSVPPVTTGASAPSAKRTETSAKAVGPALTVSKESSKKPVRKSLPSRGADVKAPVGPAPKVAATSTSANAPVSAAAPPLSAAAPRLRRVVNHQHASQRSESAATWLLRGVASTVVPRTIGERLGLFHIGGGQGMFWFTEIDTLIFDATLFIAIIAVARRGLLSWRNPLVWLLALPTLLAGISLAYVITNYGTLFRLREMIYIGLALIPLALATSAQRTVASEVVMPPAP